MVTVIEPSRHFKPPLLFGGVTFVALLESENHAYRIHGAGIYANIWGIFMVNVTIYSSTMDPMGWLLKQDSTNSPWFCHTVTRHLTNHMASTVQRTVATVDLGTVDQHCSKPSPQLWKITVFNGKLT